MQRLTGMILKSFWNHLGRENVKLEMYLAGLKLQYQLERNYVFHTLDLQKMNLLYY